MGRGKAHSGHATCSDRARDGAGTPPPGVGCEGAERLVHVLAQPRLRELAALSGKDCVLRDVLYLVWL